AFPQPGPRRSSSRSLHAAALSPVTRGGPAAPARSGVAGPPPVSPYRPARLLDMRADLVRRQIGVRELEVPQLRRLARLETGADEVVAGERVQHPARQHPRLGDTGAQRPQVVAAG